MSDKTETKHIEKRRLTIVILVLTSCACCFWIFWLIGFKLSSPHPGGFYGWQTEAFASRQLPLRLIPNPALAKLSNPYDGSQNAAFRVLDASYYDGRYYSYFGVGPILFLTLPWHLATNSYLTEPGATAVLVTATFVMGLTLLLQLHKHFFVGLSPGELIAGYLLVTIGSYSQIHLVGINAGTVAQSGAYFCFTTALYFVFQCLAGMKPLRSLAVISLFCGLAVACRPSFVTAFAMIGPPAFLESRRRKEQIFKIAMCSMLPCAAIGAGLMYYNYLRFGSVWEFGNRFQLTNVDYRRVNLLSLANLRQHLSSFIFSPIEFSHYFPFLIYRHDVEPIGLAALCPASVLAFGLSTYLRRTTDIPRSEARILALSIGLTFVGVLLFLAAYVIFLFHYEIDFMVPWVWLVAIGWYGALSDPVLSTGQRRAISLVGTGLCILSATVATLYTISATDFATRLPRLTAAMNGVVSKLDEDKGVSFGGVGLTLKFPIETSRSKLPLLAAGIDHNDLVYAEVLPNSKVRLGYFHAGLGGPISDPVVIDFAKSHDLEIFMGSLLPPPAHPYFAGWTAEAKFRARKTFRVTLDGQQILSCLADFYDSSPNSVLIGANPRLYDVALSHFPGEISRVHVIPFQRQTSVDSEIFGSGGVAIRLRFPQGRDSGTEPLMSTGLQGRGDLVYVTYLPAEQIKLGLDHWGHAYDSQPINLDRSKPHLVTVVSSSLDSSGDATAPFEILCDSKSVVALQIKAYESSAQNIYFGINAIGSSVSGPMFGGTFLEAEAITPSRSAPLGKYHAANQTDLVSMDVLFDAVEIGVGQPLLVVGQTGKADIIYVTRLDSNHLRFGFDHWGSGGPTSEAIEFDPSRWHVIQIFLGSLVPPGGERLIAENEYKVLLDGRQLLQGKASLYRPSAENVYVGTNPIGGSTTGTLFSGTIRIRGSSP